MRRLLLAFFALLIAPLAEAHPLLQNVMWVQFEPVRVHLAVNVSVREISVAQSIAGEGEHFDSTALAGAAKKHGDYLLHHLFVSAD